MLEENISFHFLQLHLDFMFVCLIRSVCLFEVHFASSSSHVPVILQWGAGLAGGPSGSSIESFFPSGKGLHSEN